MGLVIDTSAWVAFERRSSEDEARSLRSLGSILSEPVVLPAIVLAEARVGGALADTPKRAAARKARIDALGAGIPTVDFGAEMAQEWATLFAVLTKKGRMIPSNDLAVAATAIELGFGVLVGPADERHSKLVPRLRVVTLNL